MEGENPQVIYCADNDAYRIYCDFCDKLCIERFHKNRLKFGTHMTNSRERQQVK